MFRPHSFGALTPFGRAALSRPAAGTETLSPTVRRSRIGRQAEGSGGASACRTPRQTPRRSLRWLAGLAVVGASLGLLAAPAALAQSQAPANSPVVVRAVDSTDPQHVALTFTCECLAADLAKASVAEEGHVNKSKAPERLSDLNGAATMLVIDASATTSTGILDDFKKAAKAFVAERQGTDVIGIVSTAKLPALRAGFTRDAGALNAAIDSIQANSEGGLWAGVLRSANMLGDRAVSLPSIVIMTDGNPGVPLSAEVRAAVLAAGATVYVYAADTGSLVVEDFQRVVAETKGRYVSGKTIDGAAGPVDGFAKSVGAAYQIVFASNADRGLNNVTVTVGNSSTTASYVSGSVQIGAATLVEQLPVGEGGISFLRWLRGDMGKAIGIAGGVVAAALVAYAVAQLMVKDKSTLSSVLEPYSEGYGGDESDGEPHSAAQTALIQRAVAFTSQLAERQGLLTKVEVALERADLPLRAAEALFFYIASAALLAVLVLVVSASPLMTLGALILLLMLPPAVLSYLAKRRKKKFLSQLPDTLQLLSGTLRAGYSMMQGVEAVSQEVEDPMGRELRRVVTESRLGRPLEESLEASAERMESPDFAWAVMAIRIQREVGGNLSELLLTVAETMTHRERLRRDINALTAEGRVSAIVLAILPVGLGLVMYAINPDYMKVLFEETSGKFALVGAILLAFAGFWWMKKVIEIEV